MLFYYQTNNHVDVYDEFILVFFERRLFKASIVNFDLVSIVRINSLLRNLILRKNSQSFLFTLSFNIMLCLNTMNERDKTERIIH